jgi:hypothetical protein
MLDSIVGEMYHVIMKNKKTALGRPPKLKEMMRVKELRNRNKLSFRQIMTQLRAELKRPKLDVKTVYRWYSYPIVGRKKGSNPQKAS